MADQTTEHATPKAADTAQPQLPTELPVVPLRGTVGFPMTFQPLAISRAVSVDAINRALAETRMVLLLLQETDADDPDPTQLKRIGTVAIVRQMAKAPPGLRVVVEGIARVRAELVSRDQDRIRAFIKPLPEPIDESIEVEARVRRLQELVERAVSVASGLSPDLRTLVTSIQEPLRLAYLLSSLLDMSAEEKQAVLEEDALTAKLDRVAAALSREIELLELKGKIESQAQQEMSTSQRQYFLRQQLKAIQDELGEGERSETAEIRARLEQAALPDAVRTHVTREVDRLERMNAASPEYQMIRTYLDWVLDVPWEIVTEDRLDPAAARTVLDEDHYDLDKVKDRIVEYLAVRKLKGDLKGPILCFVGPPGVGKTSLGHSIARAMNRKFVRISLGGIRDEAEIRGHRRTYIGSMPGRLVQALKQAGSINPVFMLDEIDKVTVGFQGDPAAALLEVLDPAQNHAFRDHYLEVPLDLSRVLFIATANQLGGIHPALQDRMEVISLPGYTERDKIEIARRYLIPRQLEEHGLAADAVTVETDTLRRMIEEYTREAGVRNLERQLGTVARKIAARIATSEPGEATAATAVPPDELPEYLGPPRFHQEVGFRTSRPGVATGVAWTEVGGDVLFVEARLMPGGSGSITLTGQLGNVMQESARAAVSHLRSEAAALGLDPAFLESTDLHLHVPAGAIPKDGPSAGVTMATAIVSAIRQQPIRADVAMTGEITLSGLVLPVGGIREKALAARRHGIKTFILPQRNASDIDELPEDVRRDMTFVPVSSLEEVLAVALPPDTTQPDDER